MSAANRPPDWVQDAIFYQIFPDRFARSERGPQHVNVEQWDAPPTIHGYKGGDLYGIVDRLDWLTDLGVTAIYLNPIFRSASNHRYHTHDYFDVDPLLGGDEAFDEMLAACHDRGLRVILDGVFNHASRGFFQFHDIMENGKRSPWIDWFHVTGFPLRAYDPNGSPNYDAWWGLPALPKFNTENPEVREYLMQVGEHWIDRGIDGWRLDVPEEITTKGFWEEFRDRVRAINPEAYIVGEIWKPAAEWIAEGTRFDGVMNYVLTNGLISYTAGSRVVDWVVDGIHSYQVRPPRGAGEYADHVDWLLRLYPEHAALANLNLLGSHDTPRLRTVAGGDVATVILSTTLLMTFPGAPCIYYGDEIGLEGTRDPDNRRTFPWDREDLWNQEILDATRTLIALRREYSALRTGDYLRVWPRPTVYGPMAYAFLRRDEDATLLVAVNAAGHEEQAGLSETPSSADLLFGSGTISGATVTLPPRSAAIWKLG